MKYRWMVVSSVALLVLVFGGGLSALRYWYHTNLNAPIGQSSEAILLRIDQGMSAREVGHTLQDQQLIRSQAAWRWYVFSHGLSTKLQAGLYRLHGGLDAPQVAQIISKGNTETVTVTISSGLRLQQIRQLLLAKGFKPADVDAALKAKYSLSILKDKPAKASLEGYLFADTYRLEVDRPVKELVELMLTNSEQKITPAIRAGWRRHGLDLHEGLSLASIVQKEVSTAEDQRQVAQVFLRRLQMGRKLEADPTFEYAAHLRGQTAHVGIDSPYNTYLYKGLPPTPIANIDLSAAEAVANPAPTKWLYFLSDKRGQTHFTSSEAEHKQNIERYLQ